MAKNREPEKAIVSSESEEDDEASSEEGSDSEPERTQVTKKPSSPIPATVKKPQSSSKPQQQPSSSSEEEESGSESESDSDGPDPNVRPIATKPMDDPQKTSAGARKPRSKSIASELVTPARSTAAKRPAEEKETEEAAKKAKKKLEPEGSDKKSNDDSKKLFQRIWSEDDEIAILKGMIDYATKKKSDPIADLNAFHDFIKKNLHVVDVTKTQLQDKIRRLKKKYANNKSKEKEGKDRAFSKPHEQKAYELSEKIWGNGNGSEKIVGSPKANGSAVKKTPAKKANAAEVEVEVVKHVKRLEAVNVVAEVLSASRLNFNGGGVEENILRIGAELFAAGKGAEREDEWNKLKLEEMEVYQRQLQLRSAQVKLVLDTLKSTDH